MPRIQLIDVDGDKKLDILAGTFEGRLFYLHNDGSAQVPVFGQPQALENIEIKTSTSGDPWCNYLSPYLVDWFKNGTRYLIMGDGTYSANSIYMLKDLGNRAKPQFNDANRVKIIPGMGREQLTPQVVDWNGDGKPDVLCGERKGNISIFLNTSSADNATPSFDAGGPDYTRWEGHIRAFCPALRGGSEWQSPAQSAYFHARRKNCLRQEYGFGWKSSLRGGPCPAEGKKTRIPPFLLRETGTWVFPTAIHTISWW